MNIAINYSQKPKFADQSVWSLKSKRGVESQMWVCLREERLAILEDSSFVVIPQERWGRDVPTVWASDLKLGECRVCVCMCVCGGEVYVHMYGICMSACEGQRLTSGVFFNFSSISVFQTGSLKSGDFWFSWTSCPVSSAPRILLSVPP